MFWPVGPKSQQDVLRCLGPAPHLVVRWKISYAVRFPCKLRIKPGLKEISWPAGACYHMMSLPLLLFYTTQTESAYICACGFFHAHRSLINLINRRRRRGRTCPSSAPDIIRYLVTSLPCPEDLPKKCPTICFRDSLCFTRFSGFENHLKPYKPETPSRTDMSIFCPRYLKISCDIFAVS